MDHSAPIGGKFSFDAENRFPWKGEPPAPSAPTYDRDEIDLEVETLVNQQFSEHPGILIYPSNQQLVYKRKLHYNLL